MVVVVWRVNADWSNPMSFECPESLKYFDSYEYIHSEGDTATKGITAYAVDQLGDNCIRRRA